MIRLTKKMKKAAPKPKYDCTVVVLAYNLEKFIEECLASIEKQITERKIKVLVHDDCSSDRTLEIVKKFSKQSKFDYEVIAAKENQFSKGFDFFYRLLKGCESPYVAVLDGDDIWTDPRKLEIQIKLLETNPEMALSTHSFGFFSDTEDVGQLTWPNSEFRKPHMTYEDLAKENFIGALTVVFRRSCLPNNLVGYNQLGTGDYPLWGVIASNGYIGFVDKEMAKYRVHSNQYFNTKDHSDKQNTVFECKVFVAANTEGAVKQSWISALRRDAVDQEPARIQQTSSPSENQKFSELDNEIQKLERVIQDQQNLIALFTTSWSWKITRPLRKISDTLHLLRDRFSK